ncbi:MAG TPA: hypothetical protein VFY36_09750, partial [Solirubrobacteraceae bacterium]|nr:hypothetical protein [Solirubrobacteraceae bacterium]
MEAEDRISNSRDWKQRPRSELVVASEPQQQSREVRPLRHQAAIARPSANAAWIRLPRTSRH